MNDADDAEVSEHAIAPKVWEFRWERVVYRSMEADEVAEASVGVVVDPAEAIRRIRVEVRERASALPPIERHRALSWMDGGGSIGALARAVPGRIVRLRSEPPGPLDRVGRTFASRVWGR
ncbi:hypothetical protein ACFYYY_26855 [Streptomyces sp. NPDC001834]|uniref:hypothetical protein n=1 Tax=Streptomyces sp. NPDC001834 TaxID=3364616 RepID=UPI00369FB782